MDEDNLFVEHQHPTSRRLAILEDNGTSAWLYLTEPDSRKPNADAWVYNRIPAPPTNSLAAYRGGPPPAAEGYAGEGALCETPTAHEWSFLWSANGESAAVLKDDVPVAFIGAGVKGGFSRELRRDGPWGHPWSDEVFSEMFGEME